MYSMIYAQAEKEIYMSESEDFDTKLKDTVYVINCFRYYHCPSCFLNWKEDSDSVVYRETADKLCQFCKENKTLSSLQLLYRRLNVFEKANMSDFQAVFVHLVKHIDLKERSLE